MTPRPLWTRHAPLACASMIAGCAVSPPPSEMPPRLILPAAAETPCRLHRLPDGPSHADLETAYARRGEALVLCDAARALAVETLRTERALQDQWRERTLPRRRGLLAGFGRIGTPFSTNPATPTAQPAEPVGTTCRVPGTFCRAPNVLNRN